MRTIIVRNNMLKRLPIWLVYSRLIVAALIILAAVYTPAAYKSIIVALIVYGLISDFFDGYIARLTNSSTEHLRKLDSTIDQFFWLSIVVATYLLSPEFYAKNSTLVIIILGLETATYIISFYRFRKVVATHAIASKFWVLSLLATFTDIIITGNSTTIFQLCFWVGLLTRLENGAILLVIRKWTTDVPSIYHAIQLRNGKTIKRNKIFNG